MIVAEFAWLPVTCWCDSMMVGVPQRDVRDLVTRSCGAPGCVGPNGEDELGMTVTKSGHVLDQPIDKPANHRRRANQSDHRHRNPAYEAPGSLRRLHTDNETGDRLAVRREITLVMWCENKSLREISRYLGVPYQTAVNDVHWLRKKRVI